MRINNLPNDSQNKKSAHQPGGRVVGRSCGPMWAHMRHIIKRTTMGGLHSRIRRLYPGVHHHRVCVLVVSRARTRMCFARTTYGGPAIAHQRAAGAEGNANGRASGVTLARARWVDVVARE